MYGDASAGLLLAVDVDSRVRDLDEAATPSGSSSRIHTAGTSGQDVVPGFRPSGGISSGTSCRIIAQVTDEGISLSSATYRNHCVSP